MGDEVALAHNILNAQWSREMGEFFLSFNWFNSLGDVL